MITNIYEFKNYINETYINIFNENDKLKYSKEVWDILQTSYAKIGGFKSASSPENLIQKTWLWKLVRKNNKIVTAVVYKNELGGRKLIGGGTDGSIIGKYEIFKILQDDIKLVDRKMWSEVSGPLEKRCLIYGGILISNEYASELTGKEILNLNPDGYHYTRLISGEPHEKIIIGNINQEILNNLKNN
jgi:hypothetical protein